MNTSRDEYTEAPQRKRGRTSEVLSPQRLPRRRGCNCKKSGCLKLYCECFAANVRCGDRCQCIGCKNRDHNRLEIAHAMETIVRRTHKSFKLDDVGNASTSTSSDGGGFNRVPSSLDGATQLLLSAEKIEEAAPHPVTSNTEGECICEVGVCSVQSSCHEQYGSCQQTCRCKLALIQEKSRGCSCKKSNCLKLYCECLANQGFCDARCNCEGCKNRPDMENDRQRAITTILERNPLAFHPKVTIGSTKHLRGCNCRKSNCMKNYCECHQAGVPCTNRCACQSCRNTEAYVYNREGQATESKSQQLSSKSLFPKPPRGRPSFQTNVDHYDQPLSSMPSSPTHTAASPMTYMLRTPPSQSTQHHSALELMSRTAPSYKYGIVQSSSSEKRKWINNDVYPRTVDHPTNHRSSISSRSTEKRARGLFHSRLEHAASPVLPPIEEILDAEYNTTTQPELTLSKLCRSLMTAAATAETDLMTSQARSIFNDSLEQHLPTQENGLVNLTSEGEDLICEEDMEDSSNDVELGTKQNVPHEDDHRVQLAMWQERTVLQEFSVWLRNLTATTISNPVSQN